MGVSPRAVLVDMAPGPMADAVRDALGTRAASRSARTAPDAVDVVASLDPAVLVVGPAADAGTGQGEPQDATAVHRAVAERTRWWCEAARVTGAFVVLVSTAMVFSDNTTPVPDEFTASTPVGMPGRAWRAAETIVVAAGGAVVRVGAADATGPTDATGGSDATVDTAAVADVVTWAAAGRRSGTWHVGGPQLDDLHTRIVRGTSGPGASDPGSARGGVAP